MKDKPTVIDFFCGAGGFSSGFWQEGFDVIRGVDNWAPAVQTHNLNYGLSDEPEDIGKYWDSLEAIHDLPDTDVIVGSPPCVLFSTSNHGGNARKDKGIQLIEAYLRVIAVKKHQKQTRLKAWLMENVPNSRNFVRSEYTFRQLNLAEWAQSEGLDSDAIALRVGSNGDILTASDYGAPQDRNRYVTGEVVSTGLFPAPPATATKRLPLAHILATMPSPTSPRDRSLWIDPIYPDVKVGTPELTDHFYDTGVYEVEWRSAQYAKTKHPYMGRMSFPEDLSRPSRTIMATRSASTREAILYESERSRLGDGQYRLPTIREIATLMGFPYTYQFAGGEGTKWRLVGNAVCPPMSRALAAAVKDATGLVARRRSYKALSHPPSSDNLNTFEEKCFTRPPERKANARFRRHPVKSGNMTVELTNYHPDIPEARGAWQAVVFVGAGRDYKVEVLEFGISSRIRRSLITLFSQEAKEFMEECDSLINESVGSNSEMQNAYVVRESKEAPLDPTITIDRVGELIDSMVSAEGQVVCDHLSIKDKIPVKQAYAMYAVSRIAERVAQKSNKLQLQPDLVT